LVFSGIGIFTSGFTSRRFLAMLLTHFKGVREMGLISESDFGVLVPMMTLLPLLLARGKTICPMSARCGEDGPARASSKSG
jgi:hypothetical protein